MHVATYMAKQPAERRMFELWKGRTKGPWIFAMVGEWSTMSGGSGKLRFWYRTSRDGKHWALKLDGFPTRVVATAVAPQFIQRERVIGAMIKSIEQAGGEWVDGIFDASPDLDLDLLWDAWEQFKGAVDCESGAQGLV